MLKACGCTMPVSFSQRTEAWEGVWLRAQREPDKTFLQGSIQVTAAFYHLQRNCTILWERCCYYRPRSGGWTVIRHATEVFSVVLLCHDIRQRLLALDDVEAAAQLDSIPIRTC